MQPIYTKQPIKYDSADFRNRFALGACCDKLMFHLGYKVSDDKDTMILIYEVLDLTPIRSYGYNFILSYGALREWDGSVDTARGLIDITIDWGDGSVTRSDSSNPEIYIGHNYQSSGTYTVKISGNMERFLAFIDDTRFHDGILDNKVSIPYTAYDLSNNRETTECVEFYDVYNMSHYRLMEVRQWGNLHSMASLYMGGGTFVSIAGDVATSYFYNDKYIKIPDSPLTGFEECEDFDSFFRFFPIRFIPDYFFKNCLKAKKLNYMFMGSGVKSIGKYSFANLPELISADSMFIIYMIGSPSVCEHFENFVVWHGLETVGDYAFYNCPKMTAFPFTYFNSARNLRSIGNYAFAECTSLVNIVQPFYDAWFLKKIGKGIFQGCTGLTSIQYGFEFATYKFMNAVNGKDVFKLFLEKATQEYGDNPLFLEEVGEDMFKGCTRLTNIYRMFAGQIKLTHLPERLFCDCPISVMSQLLMVISTCTHVLDSEGNPLYESEISKHFRDLQLPNEMFNYSLLSPDCKVELAFQRILIDADLIQEGTKDDWIPYLIGNAYPLWNYINNTSNSESCYNRQYKLSNWNEIPDEWKYVN